MVQILRILFHFLDTFAILKRKLVLKSQYDTYIQNEKEKQMLKKETSRFLNSSSGNVLFGCPNYLMDTVESTERITL